MDQGNPHAVVTPRGTVYFNQWQAGDYLRFSQPPAVDETLQRVVTSYAGRDGGSFGGASFDPIFPAFAGEIVAQTSPVVVTRSQLGSALSSYMRSLLNGDGTWTWLPNGGNAVTNGGFSVDTSDWSVVSGSTITRDTGQFFVGTSSMKVVTPATAFAGAVLNSSATPGTLAPFTTYTASVYVKRTSGTGNLRLSLALQDNTGATITTLNQSFAPTGGWDLVTLTFITPALSDRFTLSVLQETAVINTFYVDAVKVEPGAYASTFIDRGSVNWTTMKQRSCRCHLYPHVIPVAGSTRMSTFDFSLICADPAAYGFRQWTLSTSTPSSTVTVVNAGDANTWPILRIHGAVVGPYITNNLTGEVINFPTLSIADGDYVDVNLAPPGTAILHSTGASVASGVDPATSTAFPLYPGSQVIQFDKHTSNGVNAKVDVIYRDAWSD